MRPFFILAGIGLSAWLQGCSPGPQAGESLSLLHVSYDISRELFADLNAAFLPEWSAEPGRPALTIEQSHAGSSRQVRAVADGLEADFVSMNNKADIEFLVGRGLVPPDWQSRFPHQASPSYSTMAFVVRRGNPKNVREWADLTQPGLSLMVPHMKTTGNGRYSWLSAYAWALGQNGGDTAAAEAFLGRVLANVPAFATGGRDATTRFVDQNQGDVLLTFEAEAQAIVSQFGADRFEVAVPGFGLETPTYVALVAPVAEKRGTAEAAQAYGAFLFSPAGQRIIAQRFNRPRDAQVAAGFAQLLPPRQLVTLEAVFGSPEAAQAAHFADGGLFDRLLARSGRN